MGRLHINDQPSLQALQARAEADLSKLLPHVGPLLAVLLVVYLVWDLLLDSEHAVQSGLTRAVFAVLAALAFWPTALNWSARFRAAWAHWMLSSGVILASAQLNGGLVQGVGGIIIGLFLVPFIANGTRNFVMVIVPPALLFTVCSILQCTVPEFLRGVLLYGSAITVGFVQMHIAVAIRRHALSIETKLIWDATHDPLTEIHNRAWLTLEAEQAFSMARRYRSDLVFAMLDIDHFKRVNDTYGHQVGDQVLKAVARTVQSVLRQTDGFGRLGGEEFLCILHHTSRDTALQCAERIREAVSAIEVPAENEVVRVTISIGLAQMMDPHAGWEDMLKKADEALYDAKRSGRNCVTLSL
jgi:diguanylate cyclase (GGDEF)-like protein